ncbi:uncharacterized protein LOC111829232 [Capsella rubella]|uniref:uncharacterized protein LOC111829232 n=1 Tax=Capsella rubella TaxID=81985 RepID=UPI000CD5651A|nr:uncharacterized protein LOC111829232 [Capsella rubella]
MAGQHSFADISTNSTNWSVFVKFLAVWKPKNDSEGKRKSMILVDQQGCRIDATIPYIRYASPFHNLIVEGKWYLLSNFQVMENNLQVKNSRHHLTIRTIYQTTMREVEEKSRKSYFNFITCTQRKNSEVDDRRYCYDASGIVSNVSQLREVTFIDKQNGYSNTESVVTFTLTDETKKEITCVAVGKSAIEFENNWEQVVYEYDDDAESPIIIFLNHEFMEMNMETLLGEEPEFNPQDVSSDEH